MWKTLKELETSWWTTLDESCGKCGSHLDRRQTSYGDHFVHRVYYWNNCFTGEPASQSKSSTLPPDGSASTAAVTAEARLHVSSERAATGLVTKWHSWRRLWLDLLKMDLVRIQPFRPPETPLVSPELSDIPGRSWKMCLYRRPLMNNSGFYLFIIYFWLSLTWAAVTKASMIQEEHVQHPVKKPQGTRLVAVVALDGVIDGIQSGGFTAWPGAASIWKTNGSGNKPLALFVLMLCVNRPTRRLKMKFVFVQVFGLWFSAGKFPRQQTGFTFMLKEYETIKSCV